MKWLFQIVGSIIPAVIAPGLKGAFGWHGMFFVGFGGVFLGTFSPHQVISSIFRVGNDCACTLIPVCLLASICIYMYM